MHLCVVFAPVLLFKYAVIDAQFKYINVAVKAFGKNGCCAVLGTLILY